jgi:hypothetical protein
MSTKDAVIEMIRALPDGATWADIVAEGSARFGDPADLGEWDDEFIDEINRRVADLEAGRTKLIPADEVMARMKEKYG